MPHKFTPHYNLFFSCKTLAKSYKTQDPCQLKLSKTPSYNWNSIQCTPRQLLMFKTKKYFIFALADCFGLVCNVDI